MQNHITSSLQEAHTALTKLLAQPGRIRDHRAGCPTADLHF